MDKIIKITLGMFIVILVAFSAIPAYTAYTGMVYRNTITGTYTYTCAITTDAPLYNITLFIPVPVDRTGNSPMVSDFSSRLMKGVPADWETTLFDTGKSTMLKVVMPAILPPEGTTASHPYTITFSSKTVLRTPVETQDPVERGVIFRPVQSLEENTCPDAGADKSTRCFTYTTSVYADYLTNPDTTMTITSDVTGKNTWTIFEPHSNEYHTGIRISMKGEHRGWADLKGELTSGNGTYDIPVSI